LRRDQPRPEVVRTARRIADDNPDGLALKVRGLRRCLSAANQEQQKPHDCLFHIASSPS